MKHAVAWATFGLCVYTGLGNLVPLPYALKFLDYLPWIAVAAIVLGLALMSINGVNWQDGQSDPRSGDTDRLGGGVHIHGDVHIHISDARQAAQALRKLPKSNGILIEHDEV